MKTKKFAPIPISTAKTAWGLLQDVKRVIRAEPKRANMGLYVDCLSTGSEKPACGTVGCFGGWVAVLGRKHLGVVGWNERKVIDEFSRREAEQLLGNKLNYYTVNDWTHVFNSGFGDACETTQPGTKAHANAVIARINNFMKINAKALKARRL